MTEIDGIIFDTAYTIAGKMTGTKPTSMGECKEFDEIFDKIQEALYRAIE